MKKRLILSTFLLIFGGKIFAVYNDTIRTKYEDGMYFSEVSTCVNASFKDAQNIVNLFIEQFSHDFHKLFDWAFADLGEQKDDEEKNAFLFEIKSTEFDKMSGVSTIIGDVVVPKVKRFKDVKISSKVTQTSDSTNFHNVYIDIFYSNALLKKAFGTFFVQKCKNQIVIKTNIYVKFGWFFNIFITKKMYKKVIEWRLQKILENFKQEIERTKK
jgi:hypothetical protein